MNEHTGIQPFLPSFPRHGNTSRYTTLSIAHRDLPVVKKQVQPTVFYTSPVDNTRYMTYRDASSALWNYNRKPVMRDKPSIPSSSIVKHHEIIEVYTVSYPDESPHIFLDARSLHEHLTRTYDTLDIHERLQANALGFHTMYHALQHRFIRDIIEAASEHLNVIGFGDAVEQLVQQLYTLFSPDDIKNLPDSTPARNIERTVIPFTIRQRFVKFMHTDLLTSLGAEAFANYPLDWLLETLDRDWIEQQLLEFVEFFEVLKEQSKTITYRPNPGRLLLFEESRELDEQIFGDISSREAS